MVMNSRAYCTSGPRRRTRGGRRPARRASGRARCRRPPGGTAAPGGTTLSAADVGRSVLSYPAINTTTLEAQAPLAVAG